MGGDGGGDGSALKDIMSGTVAGIAQVIVGERQQKSCGTASTCRKSAIACCPRARSGGAAENAYASFWGWKSDAEHRMAVGRDNRAVSVGQLLLDVRWRAWSCIRSPVFLFFILLSLPEIAAVPPRYGSLTLLYARGPFPPLTLTPEPPSFYRNHHAHSMVV